MVRGSIWSSLRLERREGWNSSPRERLELPNWRGAVAGWETGADAGMGAGAPAISAAARSRSVTAADFGAGAGLESEKKEL